MLAAARTMHRRVIVAFQPHRFSRTKALLDAFGPSLSGADHVVLTDIYAAGEIDSRITLTALADHMRPQLGTKAQWCRRLPTCARPGQTCSAG